MNPLRVALLLMGLCLIVIWLSPSPRAEALRTASKRTAASTELLKELTDGTIKRSLQKHAPPASSLYRLTFPPHAVAGEIYSIDKYTGNKHWLGSTHTPAAVPNNSEIHLVLPADKNSAIALLRAINLETNRHINVLEIPKECLTTQILVYATKANNIQGLVLFGGNMSVRMAQKICALRGLDSLTLMNVVTDESALRQLTKIEHLRQLKCIGMPLRISFIAELHKPINLSDLDLDDCHLPSGTVTKLAALTNLQRLSLGNTAVTDEDCRMLGRMNQLISLRLERNAISNRGADFLKGLRNLQSIEMRHTQVGDDGVASLCRISTLRRIDLSYTQVSAAGAIVIANRNFAEISLAGTGVDDRTSILLAQNTGLKKLIVDETSVSDATVERLRAQHPQAQIY